VYIDLASHTTVEDGVVKETTVHVKNMQYLALFNDYAPEQRELQMYAQSMLACVFSESLMHLVNAVYDADFRMPCVPLE
jgi:hypothetical protein